MSTESPLPMQTPPETVVREIEPAMEPPENRASETLLPPPPKGMLAGLTILDVVGLCTLIALIVGVFCVPKPNPPGWNSTGN